MKKVNITDATIVSIFKTVVSKFPNNIALTQGSHHVTYQELDILSTELSQHLISKGLQQGDMVAICMTKSVEQIVAILAALKAGGVYLPLSPEISTERLKFVQNASEFVLSFTNKQTDYKFLFFDQVITLEVTDLLRKKTVFPDQPAFVCSPNKNDPAYVMFTSGTTGYPKGVIIPQSGVVNLVMNQNYITISEEDRFLLLSPVEFDGSTFEIWGALLHGASLILMPPGYPEIGIVREHLRKYNISKLFLTTQLFNLLVDHALCDLNQVDTILFGGEQASFEYATLLMNNRGKNKKLCNIYGPTECTTFSTYYEIESIIPEIIPIGKPIVGKIARIFNDAPGNHETGELLIGGEGLFIEYLQDVETTKLKKIEMTGIDNKKQYFFKTGDFVKLSEDGNFTFIGRHDHMVKIRGFRVYLEEVERCIREYHDIQDVAVLSLRVEADNILVAFIVTKEHSLFNLDSFKNFFLERNPLYLMPNRFVFIDAIPLNKNAKIDYDALEDILNHNNDTRKSTHQLPPDADELMCYLIDTWRKELSLADIGIDDDFFEFGGHSLKLINIINTFQQQKHFKALTELNVVDLFKYPTIRSLINYLNKS